MYSVFYNFTWNSYCICIFRIFSHPLLGGAGIRGIITPVYIICVFLQYLLLCCCIYCCICSITSEHLLLYFSCQFQIPPHVCKVYRKRKLRKSIYINTMVPMMPYIADIHQNTSSLSDLFTHSAQATATTPHVFPALSTESQSRNMSPRSHGQLCGLILHLGP